MQAPLFFALCSILLTPVHALWPIPSGNRTNGTTLLQLSPNVDFKFVPPAAAILLDNCTGSSTEPRVQSAIARTLKALMTDNFVPWMLHPFGIDFQPCTQYIMGAPMISQIIVKQTDTDPSNIASPVAFNISESYTLDIPVDGSPVVVECTHSLGCLHGLTTLQQLFYTYSPSTYLYQNGQGSNMVYIPDAPIHIEDAPKFQHRGMNFDVARNFFPVPDILRQIDALAFNKFNTLHLHITDAQSWPLVIPCYPELAEKGAYAPGLWYTPTDIELIQSYGSDRGVQVILEIDMPGHSGSIGYSHPELTCAVDDPNWAADNVAAEPPSGTLRLNSSDVTVFIDNMFDDLLPRLKEYAAFYHTGGDEVKPNAYLLDPTVRSNDSEVLQPLVNAFVLNAQAKVHEYGFTGIAWEEMLLDWNVTLAKDTLIQVWQATRNVKSVIAKGYRAIVGNYNYWYLDCGKGQFIDFQNDTVYYPFTDYCAPTKNWRLIYSFDPIGNLTAEEASMVVGGEINLWTEQTDPANLDRMVWPRACAAGEVLWSGRTDAEGVNRTTISATPRLHEMRYRLLGRGIQAEPIQPIWCAQRPGMCYA
ncbi:beta-hexosaminidase beta chain precursor [Saitoella complicata NRRL Y-17804]|nr:beta-hexosaminidase beta chain precursor [Saitoella complicata NRRL Y-17804]ODQ54027.1 beta-hexosaminidase beta chain precursor [Saitoella complicata NRRL Y-17804]